MAFRGDRQKFSDSLDQRQDQGMQYGHPAILVNPGSVEGRILNQAGYPVQGRAAAAPV